MISLTQIMDVSYFDVCSSNFLSLFNCGIMWVFSLTFQSTL
jgi:hypothetical protein